MLLTKVGAAGWELETWNVSYEIEMSSRQHIIPGVADNDWGNRDWLGDGARAVGDGEGGGLYNLLAPNVS